MRVGLSCLWSGACGCYDGLPLEEALPGVGDQVLRLWSWASAIAFGTKSTSGLAWDGTQPERPARAPVGGALHLIVVEGRPCYVQPTLCGVVAVGVGV